MRRVKGIRLYILKIAVTICFLCAISEGTGPSGFQLHDEGELLEIESTVSLQWKNDTTLLIVWPNKDDDKIILTPSKFLSQNGDGCIFSGTLLNDKGVASVDGCLGSTATIVHVASNGYGRWELVLMENGKTLEYRENSRSTGAETNSRVKRSAISITDYLIGPQMAPNRNLLLANEDDQQIVMPELVQMPLQLGYDKKFEEHFNRIGQNPVTFIRGVVNHARIYFMNPQGTKLPSKIEWIVDEDVKIIRDLSITADEMCCEGQDCTEAKAKVSQMNTKRAGISKPLMLFSGDGNERIKTIGCAYLSVACGSTMGFAWGITDFQIKWDYQLHQHKIRNARTMAHEFGHMVGLQHDFDPTHGGDDTPYSDNYCNGKGVMSYGEDNSINKGWSTCSTKDFKRFWKTTGVSCGLNVEPSPPVCPSDNEDFCPASDMVIKAVAGTTRKFCFFECPRITKVIQSTNFADTRGTGFKCHTTSHDTPKYEWCCNTRATRNIPLCPNSEERPGPCPNHGCPVRYVDGYLASNAPLVTEYCYPRCNLVNDPANGNDANSGFTCLTYARPTKQTSYCCKDPLAKTTLPICPYTRP